jgi:TonB family protein
MAGWNEQLWFSLFTSMALKSAAILGVAWLMAILLRRRSAARRHLVWTAAFAGLLALPLLSISLPSVPLPVSSVWLRPVAAFTTTVAATPAAPVSRSSPATVQPATSSLRPSRWRLWLMLVWAAGTSAGLLQMVAGWVVLWRARRAAKPLPDGDRLPDAFGIRHAVDILETRRGNMPMTFGWLRPAILLPADAAEWSEERRCLVLLHELAHVRRGDAATHLLARLALHLYWWNPLAWTVWREFVKERERAADDLVLMAGACASDYAGHLLEIARSLQSAPSAGWAAIAMARRSQLEGRLVALLESGVNRTAPRRASLWLAVVAALALTAPLAVLRAQGNEQVMPADVDVTFRAAASAKNHAMLDDAAQASAAFLQYDLARKLLDSSLAIRAEVAGQQSIEYGLGLVKIGDLERSRRNFDEAQVFYGKAVSVLGNRPEAARPLVALGTAALTRKEPGEALEYFQRAQIADPAHAGVAMMWMAIMSAQDRPQEAESLYRGALAIEVPGSAEAATTMELFAAFLERQGRTEEAATTREQAAIARKAIGARAPVIRQATDTGTPYRVGIGVTPPSLIYKVEPQYTDEARAAKYQGTAIVAVEIGPDGIARNMRVVRGLGLGLDERAFQAISQWHFKPGTKDGQPVTVMATIEVNFRLL